MVRWQGSAQCVRRQLAWKLMTSVAIVFLASGCNKTGNKKSLKTQLSNIDYSQTGRRPPLKPTHPAYIATARWARLHQKNPKDPNAALNYARSLKAIGSKERAVEVLARTYQLNPGHSELASEYGRLALTQGKVQMAEQLLNQARKGGAKEDWRVLSALGTVNSKRGDHKKAQTFYLAALRAQPGATSLYNNLALSYALDGRAGDAENLLKKAIAKGHNTPRVRQNLALVLGLQTKFGEARQIAQTDLPGDKAAADVSYLKSMVKTTKLARASTPARKTKDHARSITTAALPTAKKTSAARKKSASHAAARKTVMQIPSRKPGKPIPRVKIASAPAKPGAPVAQPAKLLPWQSKPGISRAARKARPAPAKRVKAPTAILTRASAPSWNTSVSPGETRRPAPVKISAADSALFSDFEFPESR